MTAERHAFAFSRRISPELCITLPPPKDILNAPAGLIPL
jgi:hypothetical protein